MYHKNKKILLLLLITVQFVLTNQDISETLNSELVEDNYAKLSTENELKNPICDLENGKKIALCKRIFDLPHYVVDYGIQINKVKMFNSSFDCEINFVTFKIRTEMNLRHNLQPMFPCAGRHTPVRTNFVRDDYYDKFYVSSGLAEDSVFVYISHETEDLIYHYVYDYIENIKITNLLPIVIKPKEVTDELLLNNEIVSTENPVEIEFIYINEMFLNLDRKPYPICDLSDDVKVSICEIVFNQPFYRDLLSITINEPAFYIYKPLCEENYVQFKFSNLYTGMIIKRDMFPCFGTHKETANNVLEDKYLRQFYVSSGSRPNSIFVHFHELKTSMRDYFTFCEFIENVQIKHLQPKIIKFKDSWISSANIMAAPKPNTLEDIYIKMLDDRPSKDPICDLEKGQKIALCERIFELTHYATEYRVYINKVAFSIATPDCESKPLTFRIRKDYNFKSIEQLMFPCYGRNNPVRTNFMLDNYFSKFYVSAGLTNDSVFVYIEEKLKLFHWYNVYDYLEDIEIGNLPSMVIKPKEVTKELMLNNKMFSTRNPFELESIYLREFYETSNDTEYVDPIFDLETDKKIALCEIVFNQPYFKDRIQIVINKPVYKILKNLPLEYQEHNLRINFSEPNSNILHSQKMIPCYGKHELLSANAFIDCFLTKVYISSGRRPNSVFVYSSTRDSDYGFYVVLEEFLENVNLEYLEPTIITHNDVFEEFQGAGLIQKE